jgi:DNA-binding protein H-NS
MSDTMDLNAMEHDELLSLRKDVDKALKTLESRRRKDALKDAKEAAAKYGISLSELMGDTKSTKSYKTKGVAKYQHPENADMTWTGKGRRPEWIKEHLEAGKSLDEVAI